MIRTVRGEWAKVSATLSPKICALVALGFGVGFPLLVAFAVRSVDPADDPGLDGGSVISAGINPAMVTLMVMAVIAVAAEYRFGMIRQSLAATPKRLTFMTAKLSVLAAVAFVVGAVLSPIAFVAANPVLASGDVDRSVGLGDDGVLRMLLGVPVVLVIAVLVAGAVGFLLRSPAAGIAIVVVWAVVIEPILTAVPWVRTYIGPYVPFNALGQLLRLGEGGPDVLAPFTGLAVGCAWAVALLVLAGLALRWRDA